MSKILSGEELCHVLEGLGYSEHVVEAADAIEDSHEALRERAEKLEEALREIVGAAPKGYETAEYYNCRSNDDAYLYGLRTQAHRTAVKAQQVLGADNG